MKSYNSMELLKILKENGRVDTGKSTESHMHLKNPQIPELGKMTVPCPGDSYPNKNSKKYREADRG